MADPAHGARIGIDVRNLDYDYSVTRGIGHYTRYHIDALARAEPSCELVCLGEEDPAEPLRPLLELPNVSYRAIDDYLPGELDLLHIPDPMHVTVGFDSPFRIFREKRTTITFHDLIPLRLYWSEWQERVRRVYLRRLDEVRESDSILLTNSEFTRRDVLDILGIEPSRVVSVGAGLNLSETRAFTPDDVTEVLCKYGLDGSFFLHVGALDPHKNFELALEAFRRCNRRMICRLVVVGQMDHHLKAQAVACKKRGLNDVVFTGYLSRQELEILYREATALLFLSRYEGFGLPVLEAMAQGCPVIASNAASIPEVAGDAALLFDPAAVFHIAEGMVKLLTDPGKREELVRKGRERAKVFSWDKTARKTLDVWNGLLARPGKRIPSQHRFPHVRNHQVQEN